VTLAANGLTPEEFGAFSAVYVFWGLVRMLGPLGLDQIAMREMAAARATGAAERAAAIGRLTAKRTLQAGLGIAVATAAGLWLLRAIGRTVAPELVFLVAAGVPAFSYTAIVAAQLRAFDRAVLAQVFDSVVLPLLSAAAVLALLLSGKLDLIWAVAVCGASAWVVAASFWASRPTRRSGANAEAFPGTSIETRSLWRDAVQVWQALLVTALSVRAPTYVGLMVLGLANTAILEIAIRFGTLPTVFTSGVNATLAPAVAFRHARRGRKGVSTLASVGAWASFLPALAVLLLMAVAGRQFLAWFFPPAYGAAFYPLLLVCAATTVNAAFSPASSVMLMTGGQRVVRLFSIVQLVVVCVLSASLGYRFGIEGVCWAILIGTVVRDGGLAWHLKAKQGAVSYPSVARARAMWRATKASRSRAARRR
jgi:O-antigen/teichoic acid export membrane protein